MARALMIGMTPGTVAGGTMVGTMIGRVIGMTSGATRVVAKGGKMVVYRGKFQQLATAGPKT